jgi:chromosome segregation ATPase
MARLERKEGRNWVIDCPEGRQADDAVRDMLRCGARNEAGLLAVLWSAQGKLPLANVPGGVLEDIRSAFGAQMAGPAGIAFEKQLLKVFKASWQPERMQPKKGRLHELDAQLAKAGETADANRSFLQDADEQARKARESRTLIVDLTNEVAGMRTKQEAAQAVVEEFSALSDLVLHCERDYKSSSDLWAALWNRMEQIRSEGSFGDRLRAAVPELAAALERQVLAEAEAQEISEAAALASRESARPDPAIERAEARANLATSWAELTRSKEALERRCDKLAELMATSKNILRELSTLQAPDRKQLEHIRGSHERIREARLRLEKLELRLMISAVDDVTVDVTNGAPQGLVSIPRGESYTIHGNDEMSVSFPGFASLHVSGPATDAAKWNAQIAAAESDLAQLCDPFGSDDLDVLAARTEIRAERELELRNIGSSRIELLARQREEDLSSLLAHVTEQLLQIENAEPGWKTSAPDPTELKSEVGRLRSARDEQIRQKQEEAALAARKFSEVVAARRIAEETLSFNRTQLEETERRLRGLAEDGKTIEQRRQELEKIACERDEAAKKLGEAKIRIASLPANARQIVTDIAADKAIAETRLLNATRDAIDAEATQRALLSRGPYAALAQSEEEIEHYTRERERELLRLNSIRRLWETLEEQKARAFEGIAEPVSRRASEVLAEIMGRRHADLMLSADFSETTIRPVASGREVEVTEMSGGEREQIALSVRLALAEHLTSTERHLVVLDDVLLNTDDQTLGRILNYLDQRKDRFQVAILTCHSERYRGLRGSRRIAFPPAAAIATVGA